MTEKLSLLDRMIAAFASAFADGKWVAAQRWADMAFRLAADQARREAHR
jgi:hypothetical protein